MCNCNETRKLMVELCEVLLNSSTSDGEHEHDLFDNVDRDRIIAIQAQLQRED